MQGVRELADAKRGLILHPIGICTTIGIFPVFENTVEVLLGALR